MGRKTVKRSAIAILSACAWALCILCAHLAVRPIAAHAAEGVGPDTVITVMAMSDLGIVGGGDEYEWGSFYRGIQMLDESHYKADGETVGDETIVWGELESDGDVYHLGNLEGESNPLYGQGSKHTHVFICEEGETLTVGDPTDVGHYVQCAECDFQLEVAHRPQAGGTCKDCGATLDGDYDNTYTFTVPDTFPDDPDLGGSWEDNVATIEIPVRAHLFLGCTLTLFLNCDGTLTSEYGDSLPYTIEVEYLDGDDENIGSTYADEVTYPPVSCNGSDEAIWVYTASEYDSTDENGVMSIIAGTIVITLTVDVGEDAISGLTYAGDFSATLTFSASLESSGA